MEEKRSSQYWLCHQFDFSWIIGGFVSFTIFSNVLWHSNPFQNATSQGLAGKRAFGSWKVIKTSRPWKAGRLIHRCEWPRGSISRSRVSRCSQVSWWPCGWKRWRCGTVGWMLCPQGLILLPEEGALGAHRPDPPCPSSAVPGSAARLCQEAVAIPVCAVQEEQEGLRV